MLSKILNLENVEVLNKNDQRHIIGGYDDDDPCGKVGECNGPMTYGECDYSGGSQMVCDPCVFCVN